MTRSHSDPRQWVFVVVGWTLVGVLSSAPGYAHDLLAGSAPLDPVPFVRTLASVWLWALYTPLVFRLCSWLMIRRAAWARIVAIHMGLAFAIAAMDAALDIVIEPVLAWLIGPFPARTFGPEFLRQSFINVYSYFALVALGHAINYQRLYAERAVAAAKLETELVSTRLHALEMQLRPHFFFNTLHSIASLVRARQNQAAVQMIARLSLLFRSVIDPHRPQLVPLSREVEFVEQYLAIEQIRFGDRLQVTFAVDSDTVELPVPSLILQPLVENAIHHGVSQRAAAGSVEIRARRIGGMLEIVVYDSGSAAPRARPEERVEGVGLGNTRARLTHLYGDRFSLQLRETVDGGTIAEMMLPIGDAGAEARAAG